jgi:hypothetical protein
VNFVTPSNGQFMVAGYIVAGIVYLGYVLLLVRRQRALDARWRALPPRPGRPAAPPPPDVAA